MDVRTIRELIDMVRETGIGELEVSEGDFKIRICGNSVVTTAPMQPTLTHHMAPPMPMAASVPVSAVTEVATDNSSQQGLHLVKSPMVGTFYVSASPESAPFVAVGQTVAKGDTLCIIEAMKLMNEVECDMDGIVRAVLVGNGQAVEYGQPLVSIEPHSASAA